MGKQSQIDRAIAQLEGEIAVLQAALVRLQQQKNKPTIATRRRAAVAARDRQLRTTELPPLQTKETKDA